MWRCCWCECPPSTVPPDYGAVRVLHHHNYLLSSPAISPSHHLTISPSHHLTISPAGDNRIIRVNRSLCCGVEWVVSTPHSTLHWLQGSRAPAMQVVDYKMVRINQISAICFRIKAALRAADSLQCANYSLAVPVAPGDWRGDISSNFTETNQPSHPPINWLSHHLKVVKKYKEILVK